MAKNDTILLDGIIDDRVDGKKPSERRDEVFELFAFEQLLKGYDLSYEELEAGWVDGRDDGGIDGFFILVNGHLLVDAEAFVWPKSGSEIEVWIITCKHHDTFRQSPLDTLAATLSELLDFSLDAEDFRARYAGDVAACRENLKLAYRKLSPKLRSFLIKFAYASRGDSGCIGDAVSARGEQIVHIARNNFSDCHAGFEFFGSSELVKLHRQIPLFSLELPFLEVLTRGQNYLLLASISDYFEFIQYNGKLRRYLFDSNVRDFMGLNRVNEDIRDTLRTDESADFWWLNNGVTVLASSASVVGKSIKLENIQIVNGLQTTESIFRHFIDGYTDSNGRAILVKVIVSNDEETRDAIIRSTNNQTTVELASLHATDKIQRDIEEVLSRSGFFYERRKNYYANIGHSPSEILTPLYIGAGYVALVLKNPWRAAGLRSRFMRSDDSYAQVFSHDTPLALWPRIAAVLKEVDRGLERKRPRKGEVGEKFFKGWRSIVSFIAVARFLGTFQYSCQKLIEMDIDAATEGDRLDEIVELAWAGDVPGGRSRMWRKRRFVVELCREAGSKFGIADVEEWAERGRVELANRASVERKGRAAVSREFVEKVDRVLPEQPWKPGMEREVMKKLGCSREEYFAATSMLINEGARYEQKDGVVYDEEGNVVCFDAERVDPRTLDLIDDKGA